MSWEALLLKCKEDADWREVVNGARRVHNGAQKPSQPSESVSGLAHYTLEIEQEYIAATEKDLRHFSGLSRIPRIPLKGVPSVTIPGHVSGQKGASEGEVYYLFKPEDEPVKKAKIKMSVGHCVQHNVLPSEDFLWTGQGVASFAKTVDDAKQATGLSDCFSKESSMVTLQNFIQEKLKTKEKCEASIEEAEFAVDKCPLVGPAAVELQSEGLKLTPVGKGRKDLRSPATTAKSTSSLGRSNSGLSLNLHESEGDGASEPVGTSAVSGLGDDETGSVGLCQFGFRLGPC